MMVACGRMDPVIMRSSQLQGMDARYANIPPGIQAARPPLPIDLQTVQSKEFQNFFANSVDESIEILIDAQQEHSSPGSRSNLMFESGAPVDG